MKFKFFTGLIILFIAFLLQFWLASMGWYTDLSYAALISFAFVFGFWELLVLDLIAVFVLNWQPGVSVLILVFALYPIAIYFLRNILHWQVWLQDLCAIVVGFLVLYLSVVHGLPHVDAFLADLAGGMLFGFLISSPLHRWGK